MASIVNFDFLANFSAIFTFLLILVGAYAALSHYKILGENAAIHFTLSFLVAILAAIFPFTNKLIANMAPWFVILGLFIGFLLVGYILMGWSQEDISKKITSTPAHNWAWFIIAVVIFAAALSSSFGPGLLSPDISETASDTHPSFSTDGGGDFQRNVRAVVFSPKVLGMLLVLFVAVAAISTLGGKVRLDD